MNGKYVIAVIGERKTGKTCVINNVWDLLPCYESSDKVDLSTHKTPYEIWGYVEPSTSCKLIERSYRIGVASLGDTVEEIEKRVEPLMNVYKCGIIVCACHLPGSDNTFQKIKDLSNKFKYKLITYSHFCNYGADRSSLRKKFSSKSSALIITGSVNLTRLSAMSIVNLIEQLSH